MIFLNDMYNIVKKDISTHWIEDLGAYVHF